MLLKSFKKFLIKILLDEEIEQEIAERRLLSYFDDKFLNQSAKEVEEMWQRIAQREPLILDWIKQRKNFYLQQLVLQEVKPEFVKPILLEWTIIEKIIERKKEKKEFVIKKEEVVPNVSEIKKKRKDYFRSP